MFNSQSHKCDSAHLHNLKKTRVSLRGLGAFSKLLLELGWPGHYLGAQGLSEVNPHLGEILGQGKLPEKRNQGSIQILHGTYKITEHRRVSSI